MNVIAQKRLQADLARALDSVEGWLQPAEAWELFEAARESCPEADRALAVEIGSYRGRSAIALASGLRARGGGTVVAIDPFDHDPGQMEAFHANLERAGLSSFVKPIIAFSHDARSVVADGSVTVLFVDGSHTYEDVLQDIRDWESSLADGAVIAFNDPFWTGVSRALRDAIGMRRTPFRRPRWVVNTLFFDYRPSAPWTTSDEIRRLRLRAFLKAGRIWYRFHVRFSNNDRIPAWLKRLEFAVAGVVIKPLLPPITGRWKPTGS